MNCKHSKIVLINQFIYQRSLRSSQNPKLQVHKTLIKTIKVYKIKFPPWIYCLKLQLNQLMFLILWSQNTKLNLLKKLDLIY